MLEENPTQQDVTVDDNQHRAELVTCFVCKKTVARDQARRIEHSRQKKVWVCEGHIK